MTPCCIESFATKGIREGFALAAVGDVHTCETCGTRHVMAEHWRELLAHPLDHNGECVYCDEPFDEHDPDCPWRLAQGHRSGNG